MYGITIILYSHCHNDIIAAVCSRMQWCVVPWEICSLYFHRFPYYMLSQVSYGDTFFAFNYHSMDTNNHRVEKKMRVFVVSRKLAQHMFRTVTEKQTFFVLPTVTTQILKHAKERNSITRRICQKVFRMQLETKYYYDVVRTKMEAYSLAWQLLHELDQREMDGTIGAVEPTEVTVEMAEGEEGRGDLSRNEEPAVRPPTPFRPPTQLRRVSPMDDVTAAEDVQATPGPGNSHSGISATL